MNDDRLIIYVDDHLALLVAETELTERCQSSNKGGASELFLKQLAADLHAEQKVLKEILRSVDGSSSLIKQSIAWLAEKAGRFKLNDKLLRYSELSRLIELETLCVAAGERRAFWENLQVARQTDARLNHIDFSHWQQQASQHYEALSTHRLEAAETAL